jgi:hypothetical protein
MGQLLEKAEKNKGAKAGGKKTGSRGTYVVPRDSSPTLAELGISKKESAEAQMLASLPQHEFEEIKTGKKTKVAAKRALREQKRERRRQENRK